MEKKILELCKLLMFPLLLVVFLLLGHFATNTVEREPLVIFAGGGSVKNFIEDVKDVNIDKETFPNSVYINLPSGYVPTLLKEEIERFKNEEYDNHSFLYICLSAEKITSIENKSDKVRVFEDCIGDDPLVVYKTRNCDSVSDDTIKGIFKKDTISIVELHSLVTSGKLKVYATSRKSGTYRAYQTAFKKVSPKDTLVINNAELFYEKDSVLEPCIILSSKYYGPKKHSKDYNCIYMENESKSLYVYFVAYEKDKFVPNTQILEFLNMIHGCAVSKENWEKRFNKPNSTANEPINIDSFIKSATK